MKLSLATYTYNDGELVQGLLDNERTWTVRPDEIVITDDGSATPFTPPAGDDRIRLVRLTPNQGFAVAKATGIGQATGDVILSADCDIRLAPDWLELALPLALRPEIGLVAGHVAGYEGTDTVSRFLGAFDVSEGLAATGFTDFVPGMVFLLRREVWLMVGGFGEHARPIGEDHALCAAIKRQGLRLYVEGRAVARQARRLSRAAMCRRSAVWCKEALLAQMPTDDRLIPYLFEAAARPMLTRFEAATAMGEPLFLYLDLLNLTVLVTTLLTEAEAKGALPPQPRLSFLETLFARLAPYKRLARLFRADVATALRAPLTEPAGDADAAPWRDFFLFLDNLEDAGFFRWMDTAGTAQLLADEAQTTRSYSFYGESEAL